MKKALWSLHENEHLLIFVILLLALAARLGAVFYLGVPDPVESSESGQVAARLVAGQGYTFDFYGYRTTDPLRSFIPPLYTMFVALFLRFAPEPGVALGMAQAFLSSFTCVLIYHIAKSLFGTIVGILSGLMIAFYPVFVIQAARPFTLTVHSFFLALLLLLVLSLLQRSNLTIWIAVGIVAGLNALGRSLMLGLLVVIASWLGLNRKRIPEWHKAAVVIGLFACFTLLPWTLRNYQLHGQPVLLSTNGGFTFWNGNNPFTTGSAFDVYADKAEAYLGAETSKGVGETAIIDWRPYPLPHEVAPHVHQLSEVELDRALYQAGWRFIRQNPREWLALTKTKLVSFWWFRPHIGESRADLGEHGLVYDPRWIAPYKLLYAGILPFFLTGLTLSLRRWRACALFYLLFAYLTIIYSAFNVMTRYRWEIEPYISIFAVAAMVHLAHRVLRWDKIPA